MRELGYDETLKMVMDSYWVPLDGSHDFYIHFGNDITEYARYGLFPEKAETAEIARDA
jgi:hypothetical protein